jgi:TonB family protein
MAYSPRQATFGLLPQPEGRTRSFVTSSIVNLAVLGIALYIGMAAAPVVEQHYEETALIMPTMPPPLKLHKFRPPVPPKIEARRYHTKSPVTEPRPVHMEARLTAPQMQRVRPQVRLAMQPRPAFAAAMPAHNRLVHASVSPVHLGETFGVRPNPNSARPATIAAIGNPYGGMNGPALAPHGVVRSTGIGDSTRFGSGGGGRGNRGGGEVASTGLPGFAAASAGPAVDNETVQSTRVEILSKPPVEYTSEARQFRIEGNVVLSVTFLSSGRVEVHGVLRGLGYGLDQEAVREASLIQFRPATSNGRAVDVTTRVTITFQLA